jgi:hypothetical protein
MPGEVATGDVVLIVGIAIAVISGWAQWRSGVLAEPCSCGRRRGHR